MIAIYDITINDWIHNQKESTVYTPEPVADFIYRVVKDFIPSDKLIIDPAVGAGALLKPFHDGGYPVLGIDVEDHGWNGDDLTEAERSMTSKFVQADFIEFDPVNEKVEGSEGQEIGEGGEISGNGISETGRPIIPSEFLVNVGAVILNPPFNVNERTRESANRFYKGKPMLPEIFLLQCLRMWGHDIPIIMITPHGLRMNLAQQSRRRKRWLNGDYPEIVSIMSLPRDIFTHKNGEVIVYHSEVLLFNLPRYSPTTGAELKAHYFYDDCEVMAESGFFA